jgi:hypothetical protein
VATRNSQRAVAVASATRGRQGGSRGPPVSCVVVMVAVADYVLTVQNDQKISKMTTLDPAATLCGQRIRIPGLEIRIPCVTVGNAELLLWPLRGPEVEVEVGAVVLVPIVAHGRLFRHW